MRTLLRATALALALVCTALILHLLTGQPLRWTLVGAAALSCVAIGALLVLRPRMPAAEAARWLDRRFNLHEQLSTALEIGPHAAGVGAYLYDQARLTLAGIRRQAAQQPFPWSELALTLSLGILLTGLLILADIGQNRIPPAAESLPPLVQPPPLTEEGVEGTLPPLLDQSAAPPESASGMTQMIGMDPAVLAALANALRNQSVTRPAAEALDQGDTQGAAQRLRELADRSGQLSTEARADLSAALREAARQIASADRELADQVEQSANELVGAPEQAAAGLERLASIIEQAGMSPPPAEPVRQPQGGGGGGAGQSALPINQRARDSKRLGVDGVPLELASDGPGDNPASGAADAAVGDGGSAGASGFVRSEPSRERIAIDDDPLRIPEDLRDVVQDYFSP